MYKMLVSDKFVETMKKVPSEFLLILTSTIISFEKIEDEKERNEDE